MLYGRGGRVMDGNPLKSFIYKGLDDLGDPGNIEEILGKAFGTPKESGRQLGHTQRQDILNALKALESKVRPHQKQALLENAWRCLHCKTVNGLQIGSKTTVRKTCSKCAKPRSNPLTVKQELLEENKEQMVKEWMQGNPNLTLEEANKLWTEFSETK